MSLIIIRRGEWGARAPTEPYRPYVPRAIVWHHTYIPGCGVFDQNTEAALQRQMQATHISRGWGDIGQHFTVFQSGRVFQGRPLSARGIHAAYANSWTVGIEHQGNFHGGCKPTEAQLESSARLIAMLAHHFGWSPESLPSRILPHRAVSSTACPGNDGVAALETVKRLAVSFMAEGHKEEETVRVPFKVEEDGTFLQHIFTGRPVWLHYWVDTDLPQERNLYICISKWGTRRYEPSNVVWAHWVRIGYGGTVRLDDKPKTPGEYLLSVWLPKEPGKDLVVYGDVEL